MRIRMMILAVLPCLVGGCVPFCNNQGEFYLPPRLIIATPSVTAKVTRIEKVEGTALWKTVVEGSYMAPLTFLSPQEYRVGDTVKWCRAIVYDIGNFEIQGPVPCN